MKYLGKKSVSSFLGKALHIFWYVVLAGTIIMLPVIAIVILTPYSDNPESGGLVKITSSIHNFMVRNMQNDKDLKDWRMFIDLPAIVKCLILVYTIAVMVLVLQIIKKSEYVFTSFSNNDIFSQTNITIIAQVSKRMIILSIMTFNFFTFLCGIMLLIICDVFRNGHVLQEEQKLTI